MEYTDGNLKFKLEKIGGGTPAGAIIAYAGNTIPVGWLLCNGTAVSRSEYSSLFKAIGTTYGSGDGSTTFNLPNLVSKFIEGGSVSGESKTAGLPNLTGWWRGNEWGAYNSEETAGATKHKRLQYEDTFESVDTSSTGKNRYTEVDFNASRCNAIYGNSDTVQPPAIIMQYIIKC